MRRLAAAALLTATAAWAQPPVEHFFQLPRFAHMAISPDGAHIAALSPVNGRQNLVILDTKTRKPTPVTAESGDDIVAVAWVNSRRLVVANGQLATEAFRQRNNGLFALDLDGGGLRMLSGGTNFVVRPLSLVRTLPGETDDVIVQETIYSMLGAKSGGLFRLDTRTGRRTPIDIGKPDAGESESWVVDNGGVARVLTAFSEGKVRIHYRAGPDAPWKKLAESSQTQPGWQPLAVAADGRTLLVSDRRNRDKAAIVRYDPDKGEFGEILAQHPQVDLDQLRFDEGVPVGVTFEADRGGFGWFDGKLARLQRDVDAALPGTVNRLSWSRDRSMVLVSSHSDVLPGAFYLLDVKAGKMSWLVDRAPWIKPKEMAPRRAIRYEARDGLPIPAYLTLPRGSDGRNLPLVVVVHGGPWISGDIWEFDPEAQFLASRGYAVLQPNFRGTTRYGWKHFAASFGQWGGAMQDDVTDGVKWAIAEGIADPKRVCIYGASYGGYATMMGLAKTPDLYRCGINYVGVTDVRLFLTATWADYAQSDFIRHAVKDMVGDAARDAERLKATSPVELAGRIRSPVLMAYGVEDQRVPIEHGTRMRDALERAGAKPVWLVAEGEGHGFRSPANQKMFYEAMEKFLAEHLK
jgi:dipeptidyl aminopeptidase/acylaminoacyl peptidase